MRMKSHMQSSSVFKKMSDFVTSHLCPFRDIADNNVPGSNWKLWEIVQGGKFNVIYFSTLWITMRTSSTTLSARWEKQMTTTTRGVLSWFLEQENATWSWENQPLASLPPGEKFDLLTTHNSFWIRKLIPFLQKWKWSTLLPSLSPMKIIKKQNY